jgi:hypothetical protein
MALVDPAPFLKGVQRDRNLPRSELAFTFAPGMNTLNHLFLRTAGSRLRHYLVHRREKFQPIGRFEALD